MCAKRRERERPRLILLVHYILLLHTSFSFTHATVGGEECALVVLVVVVEEEGQEG